MTCCNLQADYDFEPCRETGPQGSFTCTKPHGHDGPHAACNVVEHPAREWDR